jgi:hypothetical protein
MELLIKRIKKLPNELIYNILNYFENPLILCQILNITGINLYYKKYFTNNILSKISFIKGNYSDSINHDRLESSHRFLRIPILKYNIKKYYPPVRINYYTQDNYTKIEKQVLM